MKLHHVVAAIAFLAPASLAPIPAQADNTPSFVKGGILAKSYDGISDDLLTGGLGKMGLQEPVFPGGLDDPPTASQLRRLAIYNNYRALVDMSSGGGYGTLYGPNVTADGTVTGDPGLIPGMEFLAYAGDASGKENVTMMVQIPHATVTSPGFDPSNPCIVAAPSSGSRGVYGAIATAGEWGLKNGCAVAYTDKGTGTGAHGLDANTVGLITGTRVDAQTAGKDSSFTAKINEKKRGDFNASTPDRFAFKHAHSRLNPEKDWGKNVLQSIELAFFVLNERYPDAGITPGNTLVIASSVSNGGGASIRAAEQDRKGLIDGVAVSEPNVNPASSDPEFAIVQGDGDPFSDHSRSLYDYVTLLNVYQGCANFSQPAAPLNLSDLLFGVSFSANRCASLRDKGLLSADDPLTQALEAQAIINGFGILPEQNFVQPSHWWLSVPQAITVTYANSYSRQRVERNLCDYSFGATAGNSLGTLPGDGQPTALPGSAAGLLFATSNGIPPTGGVNVINNASADGPRLDRISVSPSSGRQDENLDGALCLRALATGVDPVTGQGLASTAGADHRKLLAGVARIRASGDLRGLPAIIVTGRNDAILPLNHTSRAYFGLNQSLEGSGSRLRYYEITNAQHLDALNAFAGFDNTLVPLHHYFIEAMDLMFDHLRSGAPLPPSQVVHTVPRGGPPGAAPVIGPANLPPVSPAPAAAITFIDHELRIPD